MRIDVLERWQQQLLQLLVAVQEQRRRYDQAVHTCQLLLRPWPRKLREEREPENKNKNAQSENNHATDQEEAELKFVNDVLSKALKTRVKISSKRPKEDRVTADEDLPTRSEEQWEVCKSAAASTPENMGAEDLDIQQAIMVSLQPEQQNHLKDSLHISAPNQLKKQHKRTGWVGESVKCSTGSSGTGNRVHPSDRVHPSAKNQAKPSVIGDMKRAKSRESAQSVRPQSRPKSGLGKTKPAHMSAPFKTDPTLHVPKRKGSNSISEVKQRSSGMKETFSGDSKHQYQKGHIRASGARSRNQVKVLPPISSPVISSSPEVQVDACFQDEQEAHLLSSREDSKISVITSQEVSGDQLSYAASRMPLAGYATGDVTERDMPSKTVKQDDPAQQNNKQDAKTFNLLSDGASLNIPTKVRRAYAKNQQLRNKLAQKAEGAKSKSPSRNVGQEFADKLEELFDCEEELVFRQQALECLHTHDRLSQVLKSLDLDNVTDSSTPFDILRAKVMAEYVLSSFSAFTEDANMLSKVQFPDLPHIADPNPLRLDHRDSCSTTSDKDTPLSESRVCYSTLGDLQRYTGLMQQIHTSQRQVKLLHSLITDLLPWMANVDFHQEDAGTMFRGIFSLLVADGNHPPALVRDALQ